MPQLTVVEGPYPPSTAPDRQRDLVRVAPDRSPATSSADAEAAQILRAAWAVLERSHFRSLKIRQVLTASNTSASTFYRCFPSKSHLLLALLEDETTRADRLLARRIAEADSAESRLRAWLVFNIRTIYRRELAERARLFLDTGLLAELPEDVHRLYDVLVERLVEVIRDGMAERVFRAGDPTADAAMVRHLVRGLLTDGLNGHLDMSEEQAVHTALDFVLRALRPARSAQTDRADVTAAQTPTPRTHATERTTRDFTLRTTYPTHPTPTHPAHPAHARRGGAMAAQAPPANPCDHLPHAHELVRGLPDWARSAASPLFPAGDPPRGGRHGPVPPAVAPAERAARQPSARSAGPVAG